MWKKNKLEGGQNTPSFSHYSHSNKTPVGSFPRDLTFCWLVLHTEHCRGNQRFTTRWKGIKEGCCKAGKKGITWQKHLYRRRNSRDGVQIIPDQVLYTGVKWLCNLALHFDIRGGYPCLVAVSRLRNVWPQGFQDSGHSLQQAGCQTLKDLFVHTAPIDGLVLIRNIKLQNKILFTSLSRGYITDYYRHISTRTWGKDPREEPKIWLKGLMPKFLFKRHTAQRLKLRNPSTKTVFPL